MRQKPWAMPERLLPLLFLSWLLIAAQSACVRLPRRAWSASGQNAPLVARAEPSSEALINLNTATELELEKLPGISRGLAARIVAHRERYGRFRRVEHLLMVRGISDRRFRAISALLTVE